MTDHTALAQDGALGSACALELLPNLKQLMADAKIALPMRCEPHNNRTIISADRNMYIFDEGHLTSGQAAYIRALLDAAPALLAQVERQAVQLDIARGSIETLEAALQQSSEVVASLSPLAAPCAAPDERVPITRIDLQDGYWIEFARKTSGASGWLLRDKDGRLLSALSEDRVELVDCALSAAHAASDQSSTVPVPTSVDMAQIMAVLGLNYLKEYAPERLKAQPAESLGEQGTPAAKWRATGEVDPHDDRYNCERAALAMGDLTDDELANEAFLNYDVRPSIDDLLSGKAKMPIVYMTAVKDRIRWLSRALIAATAPSPLPAAAVAVGNADALQMLVEVNDLCRSAHAIAERIATEYSPIALGTTFGSFQKKLHESLARQHAFILAHGGYPGAAVASALEGLQA
jgi:hypothetical protein